ncbi:insulin receptor substrate 1 isoform X2 [Drosophila busckii]|uniref:insulin receptor substrate 1 isoform X2 n=1 Tax=Drosophila busckii TaxID=30019 RepID=UPI0014328A12|nr:insulin receptor substrate 1 isoform X2 [Drosophila busckii]
MRIMHVRINTNIFVIKMTSTMDNSCVLRGYHKKLKTMKKKFFVLYKETATSPARLEYYDTEKKFMHGAGPKRIILLKKCFNINRRFDTKHKYVLGLSSREGGFGIVLNTETDLKKWLDSLVSIQKDNSNNTDLVYQNYDHVWQVVVQRKGISENVGITGNYHCCLTSKSLTFVCIGPEKSPIGEDRVEEVEILLTTIRRCGHASPQSIFYMELGRQCVLGSGELWMETEDAATARHMHDTILSAMSGKPESDMNILNTYKGKSDPNNEPMRKRSSSANEASKPINVLQKRQNPLEIRNSFSPHYNSYGRERCDSLPTRNRTFSECSNQAYITLKHGHRCNTISGSRPYTGMRHSNSPPVNTPIKCAESDESSISMDEPDEKNFIDAYRINSRTSEVIIPEENLDELASSDNSNFDRINDFENYISMTPIKSTLENLNANHLNHCTGLNAALDATDDGFNINIPDELKEKVETDFEIENQFDRPARAYSIGSRSEHTKMRKLLGHLNDVDSTSPRVRAYSVGSKLKASQCDVQRCNHCLKSKKGHNYNGSNCNVSIEFQSCSGTVGYINPRENKSTSAPLLNLKSSLNFEPMSDLMEMDFSNVKNVQHQNLLENCKVPKFLQNTMRDMKTNTANFCPNMNIKQSNVLKKNEVSHKSEILESGYLEMRPVGKIQLDLRRVEDQKEQTKLNLQKTDDTRRMNESKTESEKNIIDLSLEQQFEFQNKTLIDTNLSNVDSKDFSNTISEGRKLIHSISNEDYVQTVNNLTDASDFTGYKILQIKSDSSIISKRKNQRSMPKQKCDPKQQQEELSSCEKRLTSVFINDSSIKNKDEKILIDDSVLDIGINNDGVTLTANICERELHYASLDLPNCSGQITRKSLKKLSCESPPVVFESNSSYAKIDFDQSDSSSASSKICNL